MADNGVQHKWQFFRAGGFDQVLLESGTDLANLADLDQKLWVALSAPAKGVQFDHRTLELIDTNSDGQIRVPELLAAIAWTGERLKNLDLLVATPSSLKLAEIDDSRDEGRRILGSALQILRNLGKDGEDAITLDDAVDSEKIFAGTGFNGDGIITGLSTEDDDLKAWIGRILAACGPSPDRSGEEGISVQALDNFSAQVRERLDWSAAYEAAGSGLEPEQAEELCGLWVKLQPKIEDYFVRCSLAAFDPRGADAANSPEAELFALGAKNLAEPVEELAALPLSLVQPDAVLTLDRGVNPAWEADLSRFRELAVGPPLAETATLSREQWEELKGKIGPLAARWSSKPASPAAGLEQEHLTEWSGADIETRLRFLLEKDLALAEEADGIIEVERLLHYVRYLHPLLNNFVAFRDFYTRKGPAIFQCGTLYIDGRSCELCVPVADTAKHAALATLSRLYLVYCDCIRRGGTEKKTIAAAITNGDSDQIMVGRNGLFYDFSGDDWDATVVRIIDHPISLRQAFWAPYKKVGRMVGEQLQKMAAARSKAAEDKAFAGAMQHIEKKPETKPATAAAVAPPPQLFDVGKYVGIFAAIGLALGALGSAVATTLASFMKLQWWQMPLAIAGLMLVISGPSMLLAWFKLRQRNLGPVLDANGWAINARAKLNIPFGASLTALAKLPSGAGQLLADPFAEKKRPWKSLLLLVLCIVVGIYVWVRMAR